VQLRDAGRSECFVVMTEINVEVCFRQGWNKPTLRSAKAVLTFYGIVWFVQFLAGV